MLRTTGRRSGQQRESPAFFVRHGDAFVVVASNAASKQFPAWWLNLEADADAQAFVDRRWHPVRARRASEDEVAEVWPKLAAIYSGYDLYKSIATREMPVVMLEPRA